VCWFRHFVFTDYLGVLVCTFKLRLWFRLFIDVVVLGLLVIDI